METEKRELGFTYSLLLFAFPVRWEYYHRRNILAALLSTTQRSGNSPSHSLHVEIEGEGTAVNWPCSQGSFTKPLVLFLWDLAVASFKYNEELHFMKIEGCDGNSSHQGVHFAGFKICFWDKERNLHFIIVWVKSLVICTLRYVWTWHHAEY